MGDYDPQLALRQTIAGVLDHPSVYMGGPSRQHLRKADQIIECLRRDPRLMEALRAGMETVVQVTVREGQVEATPSAVTHCDHGVSLLKPCEQCRQG